MAKNIFVVLHGDPDEAVKDAYQALQRTAAEAEARRAGFAAEIVMAPGWDQLRVIRRRLAGAGAPAPDAIVVEPGSASGIELQLQSVQGRCGLVFMNTWDPAIEKGAEPWRKSGQPLGTMSPDYRKAGLIQARQVAALLPGGGEVLTVTGPQRSSSVADRCTGFKGALPAGIVVYETEAGQWLEADGGAAFASWYRVSQGRALGVTVVAAHSDELALGAQRASREVANEEHRAMFARAKVLGIDACPGYGRELVDSGQLAASVTMPATAGQALVRLRRFWESGEPMPLQGVAADPEPYPASSVRA